MAEHLNRAFEKGKQIALNNWKNKVIKSLENIEELLNDHHS